MNYKSKKNIEYIKTKTLLISQELVSEKDALKIKEKYEYACKILPSKEINNLALSKDDQYIITRIIFVPQLGDYGWITYSPKDGSVKSIMGFGGVKISTNQKPNEIIKVGHFKYILSGMAQNINNKYK